MAVLRIRTGLLIGLLISVTVTITATAADRIVLRNLEVIRDRSVVSFNEDGVQLDNGTTLTWDQIEKAGIAADRQEAFDQLLKELGMPLFRIRQRLIVADYRGLADSAEAIYLRYQQRSSGTAYMVKQALMWGRLAQGRREHAVEPCLRCYAQWYEMPEVADQLPGTRRPLFDKQTGLNIDLPPVWFDPLAAKEALPGVAQAIKQLPRPTADAARIYYGSLAIAASDFAAANTASEGLATDSPWKLILELQRSLAQSDKPDPTRLALVMNQLDDRQSSLPLNARPSALYWVGLHRVRSERVEQRNQGLLDLLTIAAVHGDMQPDLAAAALFASMAPLEQLGDVKGSISVRRELLDRFPHSYHAARVREN